MFVSADFLAIQYGVDDKIARFFADREPPVDNLYWKGKSLYLRFETGWIFIPLIVDLLFKCGISREQLLSEKFIGLMEKIGHISALEETKQVSANEALEQCIELVKYDFENASYFKNLVNFMQGETINPFAKLASPFKALHRGDLFLFSLCALKFDDSLQEKLVSYWFALISILLLLDDADDMEQDKISGDPNAFLESGLTKEGINSIVEMVQNNLNHISTLNKTMALKLDKGYIALTKLPHIIQLLNQ